MSTSEAAPTWSGNIRTLLTRESGPELAASDDEPSRDAAAPGAHNGMCQDSGDLFVTLERPLCGNELPLYEGVQRAQLQLMFPEIIKCNNLAGGAYLRWYFTSRQSMKTQGLEQVYLRNDRSDPELYLKARKHQYALAHSLEQGLRNRIWPSVPLLRLAPQAFLQLLQQPARELMRMSVRLPANLAFQQLERGRNESMTEFLRRAVEIYFTMAYLPPELWYQMPLAMLANQIMLAHRRHYALGSSMIQSDVDELMMAWASGHDLRSLVSYFISQAPTLSVSG